MPNKPSGQPSGKNRTAFQRFQEQLKHVDLVIEVLDARAPLSSRHPRTAELFGTKPRLIILSKKDLGDGQRLKQWLDYFEEPENEAQAMLLSFKTQENKANVFTAALALTEKKRQQLAARGILPRPVRVCVVGMPNVGKSTFINWVIGQKRAKTGDKPGITKGPQWVRVHPQIELLDTPGILPNANFAESTAQRLALLNLLPETSYDVEEIAWSGIQLMKSQYPNLLAKYMGSGDDKTPDATLEQLAIDRKFVKTGGKPDSLRAANVFLQDLRQGKLGRVTLDQPPQKL